MITIYFKETSVVFVLHFIKQSISRLKMTNHSKREKQVCSFFHTAVLCYTTVFFGAILNYLMLLESDLSDGYQDF